MVSAFWFEFNRFFFPRFNRLNFLECSCKSRIENSIGCTNVSKTSDVLINNIDIDRELSRLHSLTFSHMERIENVLSKLNARRSIKSQCLRVPWKFNKWNGFIAGACKCQAACNVERPLLRASVIEDVQSTMGTLQTLRGLSYNIEQEQRGVLRTIARETKYGSKWVNEGPLNFVDEFNGK